MGARAGAAALVSLGPPPAERRREHTNGPLGPWHATITIDAVSKLSGRRSTIPQDWLFEVAAEWTGPPMLGMPPSDVPVHSRDVVVAESLEEARQVAGRAAEWFREAPSDPPDLRAFLKRNSDAYAPRPGNGAI